jgi:FixJ family two-component response regulator
LIPKERASIQVHQTPPPHAVSDPALNPADGWVAVVDDDDSIRRALARALRLHGLAARTFASAEEYLGRSPRDEPRCLVLDVDLGALSGFGLQDRLAAAGRTPPIVFITAMTWIPEAQLAARSRPHGFLRKPFAAEALVALVRRCVADAAPSLPPLES